GALQRVAGPVMQIAAIAAARNGLCYAGYQPFPADQTTEFERGAHDSARGMEEDRQSAVPHFRQQSAQALRRPDIDPAVCGDPFVTAVPAGICIALGDIERD